MPAFPSLYQWNTRVAVGELARALGRTANLDDLPDATLPDTLPAVSDPEPTGERPPAAVPGPAAVPPEPLGLVGGLGPPERAGVDARSEALFARHVLRC